MPCPEHAVQSAVVVFRLARGDAVHDRIAHTGAQQIVVGTGAGTGYDDIPFLIGNKYQSVGILRVVYEGFHENIWIIHKQVFKVISVAFDNIGNTRHGALGGVIHQMLFYRVSIIGYNGAHYNRQKSKADQDDDQEYHYIFCKYAFKQESRPLLGVRILGVRKQGYYIIQCNKNKCADRYFAGGKTLQAGKGIFICL